MTSGKKKEILMPILLNSLIEPLKRHSMFEKKLNCLNDYRQRPPPSTTLITTTSYFRPIILMKQMTNVPLSLQRMMINDDHKHTIELMQQQSPSSSSSVNHIQSSSLNYHHHHLTQKKSISSSQIRLGLRCLCPFDEKQQQLFDQIFSSNEQTTHISQCIFNQYISPLTTNSINTLIILSGQYREIHQIQHTLISLTITHLYHFITKEKPDFLLRITLREFSREFSSDSYSVICPIQTISYLQNFCSNSQSYPLLITFDLINRLSNINCIQLHLLSTNANNDEFSNLLMSLSLSLPSNRQKQPFHLSSNLYNSHEQSLTSILNEYIDEHFLYILATVNNNKQFKYWIKIQRLLKTKRNRLKMSSIETVINHPDEEIWVDGPLSSSNPNNEIWIDGPRSSKIRFQKSTPKHRSKPMHTKPKLPFSYSHHDNDETTFDTESIVSSHCHIPVLPVFKDHSLLPFRSNHQTLPKTKPLISENSKMNFKLSTNQLNDDLEMLEKTLETLLIPSPIVPNETIMSQSLNRMEQLSSLMSNDEKNKRLSRIVSPTRFDKILSTENHPPSVPNSPFIIPKNRHSRTPNRSVSSSTKKPKIPVRTTSLAETNSRPSILQRLFGLRSSINSPPSSPLISPLTVTLDSHDDLMPLTTSSTASSGRASSSGYESMSNTVLEEMMGLNGNNSIKIRNKSIRKDDRRLNSPIVRDKSQHQQRLSQLKHRQNELKLELAMTKTFLLMDKNKNYDHNDSVNSTISNSPMHTIIPNTYEEEVDEIEKDIEHLEKRLTSAKSQLVFINYQKNKQFKS